MISKCAILETFEKHFLNNVFLKYIYNIMKTCLTKEPKHQKIYFNVVLENLTLERYKKSFDFMAEPANTILF